MISVRPNDHHHEASLRREYNVHIFSFSIIARACGYVTRIRSVVWFRAVGEPGIRYNATLSREKITSESSYYRKRTPHTHAQELCRYIETYIVVMHHGKTTVSFERNKCASSRNYAMFQVIIIAVHNG